MRILILNPNTTGSATQLMMAAGKPAAAAGTELVPLTATRGVPYIATRAEAQIGGAIALEMIAATHRDVDAVIIAAFGDPGLLGAREYLSGGRIEIVRELVARGSHPLSIDEELVVRDAFDEVE